MNELIKLSKEYLGALGPIFLTRELEKLGIVNINHLTDNQKESLSESLMKNLFFEFSSIKKTIIRSKLRSILYFSEKQKDSFNKKAAINYLLGRVS